LGTNYANTAVHRQRVLTSRIEEIHQVPVTINDSIDLARLSCLGFSGSIGRGSAVLGLVGPVVAELIAILDYELGSGHDWERKKEESEK